MINEPGSGLSPNQLDSDATHADSMRMWRDRIIGGADGVFHFPIRHHSPACALHLARALAELRPATLVLEMPADFADLVPLILDPATRPPVAIVSIVEADGRKELPAVTGYWPLSESSPEAVALRHAAAHRSRLVLADMPSAVRLEAEDDDQPSLPAPVALTDEQPFAYSDYAQALVARLRARDFNEAWDRLFESRAGEDDWRAFFGDIGVHCALARHASRRDASAEHDVLLAREVYMREALREAVAAADGAPIAVVTGGFLTPALLDLAAEPATPSRKTVTRSARACLVRYGHRHLDALNGYAAGLPSPRYYEQLHQAVAGGAEDPFMAVAEDVLVGLSARLRLEKPALAPALPTLVAALKHARDLAALRDLAGPGHSEILDAARSCFVKDEDVRFGSPLLEMLHRELTGEAIGDVPASAGSPPLVEAARARGRALGFKVDDGLERKRELDIHRKLRHRAASRYLHAMALLETGFGRKVQGPDYRQGVNTGALFEIWTCAWSPLVEGRLVALAGEGDSLERACAAVLYRRAEALEENGSARDSSAVADLVMIAAQAGVADAANALMAVLGRTIALDPQFARIVDCLGKLDTLWRGRQVLGLTGTPVLIPLLAACYRRAIDLLPRIATSNDEFMVADAGALAALHHMLEVQDAAASRPTPFDRELLDDGVAALLANDPPPLVLGVVAALANLAGRLDEADLAGIVCGALGGSDEPEQRSAPLAGLIMVQPALLRRCEAIVTGMDAVFEALDETAFLDLLPHLRLALAGLAPHETDDLAARVARMKGLAGPLLPQTTLALTTEEVIANARRSQALTTLLEQDGRGAGLSPAPLAPAAVRSLPMEEVPA